MNEWLGIEFNYESHEKGWPGASNVPNEDKIGSFAKPRGG